MTTGLAIAALVLSVISLAFTGYQWRRAGPGVVVSVATALPDQVAKWWRDEEISVRAEVMSGGRLPVSIRALQLRIEWSDGSHTYYPPSSISAELPATLPPTAVVTAGFGLPTEPPAPSLVPCCAQVEVQRGIHWSRSRVMPLR